MTKELSIYKELCIIKDKEIERLNKLVLQQQETIADLQQYLVPPKFKKGDLVKVFNEDNDIYIIEDFVCYDESHAVYNIHLLSDEEEFDTVSEVDLEFVK